MKKEMIVCNECNKEYEKESINYVTIFTHVKGVVTDRKDYCSDCWNKVNDLRKEDEGK